MLRLTLWVILLTGGLVAASPATAGDKVGEEVCSLLPKRGQIGSFNLQLENDYFAATDRHYTNGLRASWTSTACKAEDLAQLMGWTHLLPTRQDVDRQGRVEVSLGQNIYTPENISNPDLIANDRPYAGWLYLGFGFLLETKHSTPTPFDRGKDRGKWRRLDSFQLDLGVVGPLSLAEETQTRWHNIIDTTQPRGWDHQLASEPGLVLTYESKYRLGADLPSASMRVPGLLDQPRLELMPHWGLAVGNVATYASVGTSLRFGDGLDYDYGPPRIRPSLPGSGYMTDISTDNATQWYVYGGVELRAVARNIFLDGNTFRDSHHVSKKPLVWDLQGGVVLVTREPWGHPLRLAYSQVYRSREFFGQRSGDLFGVLSLTLSL